MKKNRKIVGALIITSVFCFAGNSLYAASAQAVNLRSAGDFTILSKTGISTTGTTSIVGDIGVSPAAATYITGFSLDLPYYSTFATSSLVSGHVFASDYTPPTPSKMSTAVSDMETAYIDANSRATGFTELGSGNIGGLTLAPGVYKWGTGLTIPTDVTLSGSSNDVWIFQIAQNLNVSSGVKIILAGGAQSNNIYWVVAGQTTIGTTAVFNGNILDQTAIVLNTGATLNGRALAQTAVTLDSNSVNTPTGSFVYNVVSTLVPTPVTAPIVSSNNSYSSSSNTSTDAQSTTPTIVTVAPGVMMTTSSTQKASYNFGLMTLKQGSTGNAVMELQRFLNAKLNLGLMVDGRLGAKTIAVIKKWQKDNGLVSDGLIGSKTKAMMNSQVK